MSNTYSPAKANRNKAIDTVGLTDILVELARGINLKLNCHAIAQIKSFNATTQTCTATINYQKTIVTRNSDGTYSEKAENYPVLVDVPVIILIGGNSALTFPISAGDDCLILFNDRDMDNWVTSGQVLPPNTARLHDLNDGVALVGLRPATKAIASYDTTRARLQNGNTYVGVGASKVKIDNGTKTLKDLLDATNGILKILNDLNTALVPTTGINPASQAAITAQIVALNTVIGSLLE